MCRPPCRRSGSGDGAVGDKQVAGLQLCKAIDERAYAFLDRPLAAEWPYLLLDATSLKQREGGRIVSVAAIIAVAANTDGRRETVGLHIGSSEPETFWSTFPKSWARCGGSARPEQNGFLTSFVRAKASHAETPTDQARTPIYRGAAGGIGYGTQCDGYGMAADLVYW